MLDFDKTKLCVGCGACYSVCPQKAIKMVENDNGFYTPVITEDCIRCERCESICPVLAGNTRPRTIDALECEYTYHRDDNARILSTSGGVFYGLAVDMIDRGGMVCGCIWDGDYTARHVCTDDIDIVKKMRGSKYVQSDMGDCFIQIRHALKTRPVLFSGTPCQTTALRHFLGDGVKNLVACALICGGVPSVKVWRKYKLSLENTMNAKIIDLQMRSKDTNWHVPEIKVSFGNGKIIREILLTENLYGTNFGMGLTVAGACMHCAFKLDTMQADILIGDHWGITPRMLKKTRNKGTSVVIPLSDHGERAMGRIRHRMYSERGDIYEAIASHEVLMKDHCPNEKRAMFFDRLDKQEITALLTECLPSRLKASMPMRKQLQKRRLYIPIYSLRWKMKNRLKTSERNRI